MFAIYEYSNFPEVKVTFNGGPKDDSDFQLFLDQWEKLYEDKNNFTFTFDMKNISYANPKYCYRIANFISELKKKEIQYLLSTTIINFNSLINKLIELVFYIQKPIARVSIVYEDGTIKIIDP